MGRYVAHGWTDDDWDNGEPLRAEVSAPDSKPVDTGLVDLSGRRIMRLPNPIGFGRDKEW